MSYQNRKGPNGRELEEFNQSVAEAIAWFTQRGKIVYVLIAALLVVWLLTGIYVVQPGEEGVLRTFGRFSGITTAGLSYRVPWPFQSVRIVDVESIRRVEIGFRTSAPGGKQEALNEALMLTEDENIVQVELLVQYRIANSRDFVFNVLDPEGALLGASAEVALRSTVGQMSIDDCNHRTAGDRSGSDPRFPVAA